RNAAGTLKVGVVERKFGKRRRFLDAHAGRRQPGKGIHDHPVVRAFAQAAANTNDVECLVGHWGSSSVNQNEITFGFQPGPSIVALSAKRLRLATCSAN